MNPGRGPYVPYPYYPPPRQPGLLERTVVDQQAAHSRAVDPRPWGVWPWLGPILALLALIVVGDIIAVLAEHELTGDARTIVGVAISFAAEGGLLLALVAFGREIARRAGGWRTAFGLDTIRGADWLPWITGVGMAFIGRLVITLVVVFVAGPSAPRQASNLSVGHVNPATIAVLGVIVCVLAPITEELMFRGLLLRTFLRRMPFWPAALLSSGLFGLFHVYEVTTLVGAVTLALEVGVLGMTNCYLVRITGRLAPGMMVHATFNAASVLYLITQLN